MYYDARSAKHKVLKFKFGGLQGQLRNNKNIMFLTVVFVWSSGNVFMKTIMR
jgi:hypothetical protein